MRGFAWSVVAFLAIVFVAVLMLADGSPLIQSIANILGVALFGTADLLVIWAIVALFRWWVRLHERSAESDREWLERQRQPPIEAKPDPYYQQFFDNP
jgi:hypothetical protein